MTIPTQRVAGERYIFGFRPVMPEPITGCQTCASFVQQNSEANTRYDFSRATDLRILMRQHQYGSHR